MGCRQQEGGARRTRTRIPRGLTLHGVSVAPWAGDARQRRQPDTQRRGPGAVAPRRERWRVGHRRPGISVGNHAAVDQQPVRAVEDGKVVGIVDREAILRAIAEEPDTSGSRGTDGSS